MHRLCNPQKDSDPLQVMEVGARARGIMFCVLLQDVYGRHRNRVQVRVWCCDTAPTPASSSSSSMATRTCCAYLKYVKARPRDRALQVDHSICGLDHYAHANGIEALFKMFILDSYCGWSFVGEHSVFWRPGHCL
jgi:hypothetical protein